MIGNIQIALSNVVMCVPYFKPPYNLLWVQMECPTKVVLTISIRAKIRSIILESTCNSGMFSIHGIIDCNHVVVCKAQSYSKDY